MKKMRMTSILAGAILLTACAYNPFEEYRSSEEVESYIIYDEDGNYAGRIDGTYRIYDKDGNYVGMIQR